MDELLLNCAIALELTTKAVIRTMNFKILMSFVFLGFNINFNSIVFPCIYAIMHCSPIDYAKLRTIHGIGPQGV